MSKVSMGKRATQYFCLFTMLAFSFLSACNDKESAEAGPVVSSPSISILAPLHFPQQPSKEIMAEIERLTGVKLDIRWVPEGSTRIR